MLEAVPYSSASILEIRDTWSLGGIISEIILVPFLWVNKENKVNCQQVYTKCKKNIPSGSLQTLDELLHLPHLHLLILSILLIRHFFFAMNTFRWIALTTVRVTKTLFILFFLFAPGGSDRILTSSTIHHNQPTQNPICVQ